MAYGTGTRIPELHPPIIVYLIESGNGVLEEGNFVLFLEMVYLKKAISSYFLPLATGTGAHTQV